MNDRYLDECFLDTATTLESVERIAKWALFDLYAISSQNMMDSDSRYSLKVRYAHETFELNEVEE